ncbi:hypothetical protein ACFLXG_00920 [Chloroflexota bacterium]
MEQTLLFIGAMLVAFQYVGEIGYTSTLFSLPFTLPIKPLMKKIGLTVIMALPPKVEWNIRKPSEKKVKFYTIQVVWWMLFILSIISGTVVAIALSPIMFVYLFIGRPLIRINKLLNLIMEKSMTPWKDEYIFYLRESLKFWRIEIQSTDAELWEARKQRGEKPFVAFIGLLCIIAGFILQLL